MWLLCDANMAFGHGYIDILKEQFSEYMTSEIESNLFFAGSNIAYSIQAFMAYKKNSKLNDVLKFTEHFLSKQFDDFDNWCSEIMMAMPDEEDAEESQDPS
jgi:hypothetical protein